MLFCYKKHGWEARKKVILFCLLQFWREGGNVPSLRSIREGRRSFSGCSLGHPFVPRHPYPNTDQSKMGNPWAWQLAVTSLHGLHRGSPGSQQEWCRPWSWAESTESSGTERRIGSSLTCEHTAGVEGAVGKGWRDCFSSSVLRHVFSLFWVAQLHICADPHPFGMFLLLTIKKRCGKTASKH